MGVVNSWRRRPSHGVGVDPSNKTLVNRGTQKREWVSRERGLWREGYFVG